MQNRAKRPLNRLPLATYRLQFNRQFTFAQATEIIGYLAELGISDVYASPLFVAGPESTHGYDVCGFDQLNPNLGSAEDFQRLSAAIREQRLGLLLDMVPNHMGSSSGNRWWRDVLRNGVKSKYARYFDVDWEARPDRKVLLPVLGDRYGEVLKRGELRLELMGEEICLAYFDNKYPLAPETEEKLKAVARSKAGDRDPASRERLKRVLDEWNQDQQRLHEMIQDQNYRLVFWRIGPHEINYRRFFDVTELVSVRVEDAEIFKATHEFAFELIREGHVTGLRIDHPDGLRDPKTYFDRLQAAFHQIDPEHDLFVEAEKILSNQERLPDDWAICGTTGYDYLNYLNGIFVARENEAKFTEFYREFTGGCAEYGEVEYEAKKFVLKRLFPKEVQALTGRLRQIADKTAEGIDFTEPEFERAIIEFIAAFPVYRTYVREGVPQLPAPEQGFVRAAVESAAKRAPEVTAALKFLERVLLLEEKTGSKVAGEVQEFAQRFQQLTGPATAKGLEDTAFYRYVRFVSLNEVGGNPGQFGLPLETFHAYNEEKQRRWPHSQLATSTHDTKRGEDVRARLNVLSEIPTEWSDRVRRWAEWNREFKTEAAGMVVPSANEEYLLYQILAGSWTGAEDIDGYIDRIQQYMEKALREAKDRTSWTDRNEAYEKATKNFVAAILRAERFRRDFEPFARRMAEFAVFNSLAQVVLKLASPGVPDFYQGTELWDFNLVDPDNRRPVDYGERREMLQRVRNGSSRAFLANAQSAEVKLFVTSTGLKFRQRHRAVFDHGAYIPLPARGGKSAHVVAFARELNGKRIVVVAPRFPLTLLSGQNKVPLGAEVWGDTELERLSGTYRNEFTGTKVSGGKLAEIFSEFPVALLEPV